MNFTLLILVFIFKWFFIFLKRNFFLKVGIWHRSRCFVYANSYCFFLLSFFILYAKVWCIFNFLFWIFRYLIVFIIKRLFLSLIIFNILWFRIVFLGKIFWFRWLFFYLFRILSEHIMILRFFFFFIIILLFAKFPISFIFIKRKNHRYYLLATLLQSSFFYAK